jgi:hypothetical protein
MENESEAKHEWREATPKDSDEGSSTYSAPCSNRGMPTSYESEQLPLWLSKKSHIEEKDDTDFNQWWSQKVLGHNNASLLQMRIAKH